MDEGGMGMGAIAERKELTVVRGGQNGRPRWIRASEMRLILDQTQARLGDLRAILEHAARIEEENAGLRVILFQLMGMLVRVRMGTEGFGAVSACDETWVEEAIEKGPVLGDRVMELMGAELDGCARAVAVSAWQIAWRERQTDEDPQLRVIAQVAWFLGVDVVEGTEPDEAAAFTRFASGE